MRYALYFDGGGASVGGPGGWGAVLQQEEPPLVRTMRHGYLEDATNNVAEYTALIRGLEFALEVKGLRHLHIVGDSQLVLRQVIKKWWIEDFRHDPVHMCARLFWTPAVRPADFRGYPYLWKCKRNELKPLHRITVHLLRQLPEYDFEWTKGHAKGIRTGNHVADELATKAIRDKGPLGPLPALEAYAGV